MSGTAKAPQADRKVSPKKPAKPGKPAMPLAAPPIDGSPEDTVAWVFSQARTERGHKRRDAILEAATTEFLTKGYEGASLRSIIAAAGGSSETLYRQFENKAGLFQAVVERHMVGSYEAYLVSGFGDRPLEVELTEFGMAYATAFIATRQLDFYRMTIGESAAMPELSGAIWEHGRVSVERHLSDYLRGQVEAGAVDISNTLMAARQFMEMAKGSLHLHKLCNGMTVTPEDIAENVALAVRIFVNGVKR